MPIVPCTDLIAAAERGKYAVGYFESWDLESLMAVADAAEAVRSPVLLGLSGIYLNHTHRVVHERLSTYAAMGLDVCKTLSVPCNLVFNESPDLESVFEAINLGFGLVMFSDENLDRQSQIERVCQVVKYAHQSSVMVEGEAVALPGLAGDLSEIPDQLRITDLQTAIDFIQKTQVDVLAVNLGQAHLHGRQKLHLDLSRLSEITDIINTPLVLHGTSSVYRSDLVKAIHLGIRKINVGSVVKQAYFEGIWRACQEVNKEAYNPYEVIGSGFEGDILVAGRLAMQKTVEELMHVFGSAGRV